MFKLGNVISDRKKNINRFTLLRKLPYKTFFIASLRTKFFTAGMNSNQIQSASFISHEHKIYSTNP